MSDNTNTHDKHRSDYIAAGWRVTDIDAGDEPCHHPTVRLYAWWARDDTVIGGQVLCVGCRECGAVDRNKNYGGAAMTRLILALALVMALALPPAKAPSCYLTGTYRNMACRCGRVSVPLWVCKAVTR